MLEIRPNEYATEEDLLLMISNAESEIKIWKESIGIPMPRFNNIITYILDGGEYIYISTTLEEDEASASAEMLEILEQEKLDAQTIPSGRYAEFRLMEYPSINDQLDMQYHDKLDDTNTWENAVAAIKAKYPKPE